MCESSTRHRVLDTDQLLTNYSFITRSLALSLALVIPHNRVESSANGLIVENHIKREMRLDFVVNPPLDSQNYLQSAARPQRAKLSKILPTKKSQIRHPREQPDDP